MAWWNRPKKAKKERRYPPGSNPPAPKNYKRPPVPSPPPPPAPKLGDFAIRIAANALAAGRSAAGIQGVLDRYDVMLTRYHQSHVRIMAEIKLRQDGKITESEMIDRILAAMINQDHK